MAVLHGPALPLPSSIGVPLAKLRSGRRLLFGVLMLVIVVAALQVNQFSRLTSTGYEINELNRERAAKQAENHALEAQVAELSSLARVDLEARLKLQMEPAQQKLYIGVNQQVPERSTLPARFVPPGTPAAPIPAAADNPVWKRLLKHIPFFQ